MNKESVNVGATEVVATDKHQIIFNEIVSLGDVTNNLENLIHRINGTDRDDSGDKGYGQVTLSVFLEEAPEMLRKQRVTLNSLIEKVHEDLWG